MSERVPAEVFPPAEFIQEELDERGWTWERLAETAGLSDATIAAIRAGERIDVRTACALEHALGVSADLWVALDLTYRRHRDGGRRAARGRR